MNVDSDWKPPESIWERRRKAPFHFLAKADNARMSAYALSHIDDDFAAKLTSGAGYNGAHFLLSAKPLGARRRFR